MKNDDPFAQKLTKHQQEVVDKIYDMLAAGSKKSITDPVERAEAIVNVEQARLIHLKGTQQEHFYRLNHIACLMEAPDLKIPDSFFDASIASFRDFAKHAAPLGRKS